MKSVSSTMLGFTAPVYLPPIVNSNNTGTAKAGSSIINQPRRAGIVTEARINFCSSRSPRLSLLFFPYGTFRKEAGGISNSRPFQSHPMNASSPSSARNWYKENAIFYQSIMHDYVLISPPSTDSARGAARAGRIDRVLYNYYVR